MRSPCYLKYKQAFAKLHNLYPPVEFIIIDTAEKVYKEILK